MTTADWISQEFERLADSSNGTKELRSFIMQLAVRGKLVPQDPTDEPASELLKRIEEEKQQLIADRKTKKAKTTKTRGADELFYEIPNNWQQATFDDVTISRDGERVPISKSERELIKGDYDYYGASGVIDKINAYLFDKPLLLIGEDGANLINRSTPIAFIATGKYWVNNHAHVLDSININVIEYLSLHINAIDLKPYITGTAQPKMNQARMNGIPIGLPPLAEQKRIVAKVDKLMNLCDSFEAKQASKAELKEALNIAALNRINTAQSETELKSATNFYIGQMDQLVTKAEAVKPLRETILQLAVQGKLVPQDSKDEQASELLKRIEEEKQQLIAEGKIKKPKPLPPIEENEIPFEIPENWEWVKMENILVNIHYGFTASANKETKGIRLLRITDIQNNRVNWESVPGCEINKKEITKYLLKPKDILIARTGGTIGKSFLVNEDCNIDAVFASYLIRLIPTSHLNAEYIKLYLGSPLYWKQLYEEAKGTGQPNVNSTSLGNLITPLPPLAEQKRIVDKVDELMSICDQLETKLTHSQSLNEKFTQAVLSSAA